MTSIAVQPETTDLQLHSCPTCGRHAWVADGREVERNDLLDSLRSVARTAPRAKRAAARPAAGDGAGARRRPGGPRPTGTSP